MAQLGVYAVPSCRECGLASAGRCSECRRYLCLDHFGFDEHEPCATRLVRDASRHVCYVCGVAVRPRQWSTAVFAHYSDSGRCAGCGRYICGARHTRVRDERVDMRRDNLRQHRYHRAVRYCAVCAPVRGLGGLLGVGRWAAAALIVLSTAALIATRGF